MTEMDEESYEHVRHPVCGCLTLNVRGALAANSRVKITVAETREKFFFPNVQAQSLPGTDLGLLLHKV